MTNIKKDLYMRNNIRENEKHEEMNCPLCGENNYKKYLDLDKYNFVKCKNCSLVYQAKQPIHQNIVERYDLNYFEYEKENHKKFFNLQKLTLNDIDFEKKFLPAKGKKFLDIGSATGLLLMHAKEMGFEEYGVELCKESADYARSVNKVNVYNSKLEETNFENDYFDIIHFSHLIEHLKDIRSFMNEVYRILKPGGTIIITTPRIDSPAYHIYKKKWRSAIPDHLQLFSKKTLSKLIVDTGFKISFQESWGCIPIDSKVKVFKKSIDKLAKKYNFGDVICIVAEKK